MQINKQMKPIEREKACKWAMVLSPLSVFLILISNLPATYWIVDGFTKKGHNEIVVFRPWFIFKKKVSRHKRTRHLGELPPSRTLLLSSCISFCSFLPALVISSHCLVDFSISSFGTCTNNANWPLSLVLQCVIWWSLVHGEHARSLLAAKKKLITIQRIVRDCISHRKFVRKGHTPLESRMPSWYLSIVGSATSCS